jgi:uncharacterized protein YbjT (DUF2867 family)
MIFVAGASSRLGRQVTRRLVDQQRSVRAAGRNAKVLRELQGPTLQTARIDFWEPGFFPRALDSCEAVFTSVHALTDRRSDAIERVDVNAHMRLIDAAVEAGVSKFVYTSAAGADSGHPHAFLRAKAQVEAYLASSGLRYVILRPTAFMDLHAHELIGHNVMAGKRAILLAGGESPTNFVAVADVAQVAAAALTNDDLIGKTIEVLGPENMTDRDVVELYSTLAAVKARSITVPAFAIRGIAKLARPFHSGIANMLELKLVMTAPDIAAEKLGTMRTLLHRSPVSLEEFARDKITMSHVRSRSN